MNAEAIDPGTVTGKYTYEGTDYPLKHVYAIQPPGQVEQLWVFATDREVPAAVAKDHSYLAKMGDVGGRCYGVTFLIDLTEPELKSVELAIYNSYYIVGHDRASARTTWQRLLVRDKRVAGKLQYKVAESESEGARHHTFNPAWSLDVEFSAPVYGASGKMRTLSGAQAQQSPQAEVFLAYDKALLTQGIDAAMDAARVHMTAEKLAAMKDNLKQLGEAGFKEFQTQRRKITAQDDARRRQIENVVVDGDIAVLRLRAGPNGQGVVSLSETLGGWKIAKRSKELSGGLCPRCVGANVEGRPTSALSAGLWVGAFAGLLFWMYLDPSSSEDPLTLQILEVLLALQIPMLCLVGIGTLIYMGGFVFEKNLCKDCGHKWR